MAELEARDTLLEWISLWIMELKSNICREQRQDVPNMIFCSHGPFVVVAYGGNIANSQQTRGESLALAASIVQPDALAIVTESWIETHKKGQYDVDMQAMTRAERRRFLRDEAAAGKRTLGQRFAQGDPKVRECVNINAIARGEDESCFLRTIVYHYDGNQVVVEPITEETEDADPARNPELEVEGALTDAMRFAMQMAEKSREDLGAHEIVDEEYLGTLAQMVAQYLKCEVTILVKSDENPWGMFN